jgi:hypothetical protein
MKMRLSLMLMTILATSHASAQAEEDLSKIVQGSEALTTRDIEKLERQRKFWEDLETERVRDAEKTNK